MDTNLGTEIMDILTHYGYDRNDIDWIGNYEVALDQDQFFDVAFNTNYDNGYGWTEIPFDLLIMMKDGNWFSRREYDGKEWFVINRIPPRPTKQVRLTKDKLIVPYDNYWDLDAMWLRWFIK